MDGEHFDHLTRSLLGSASRRAALLGFVASAVSGPLLGRNREDAAAKKKHKKRKKRKKKVKRNAFGCVDVGKFCNKNGDCCSGVCQGKKDKKRCQAHDTGGCQAGQQNLTCGGANVPCTTSDGTEGICDTTTGNAGYCQGFGECFRCTKDADCVPFCGPQAACAVCETACEEEGNTGCVGPSEDSCDFQ